MKSRYRLWVWIPVLLGFFGCQTEGLFESGIWYNQKIQVRHGIVKVNSRTHELDLFRVTETTIRRQKLHSPMKGEIIHSIFNDAQNENSTRLFTIGYPAEVRQSALVAGLTVIAIPSGEAVRYETGSLFSGYRFSPDGNRLVLYHQSDDMDHAASLFNPNEIAIVDLTAPPSETNPLIRSIDIQGHMIEDIFFLDSLRIGDISRQLVAFVTDGMVQLMDFADADLPSLTVRVKTPTDRRRIVVHRMEATPALGHFGPRIFAVATGATEIYDFELSADAQSEAGFSAVLNLLDTGVRPTDFAVVRDDGRMLLVVAEGAARIQLFEVDTAAVISRSTNGQVVQHITRRQQEGAEELVLWGANSSYLFFLRSDGLSRRMGSDMESLHIPDGIRTVRILDTNRFLIHPERSAAVIVADLHSRTLTHLISTGSSNWQDAVLHDDTLFLAMSRRISFLDILSGQPMNLELDEAISRFYVFPHQGTGVAMHNTATGRATVFPLDSPTREDCRIIDGFHVDGIMNRMEDQP